MRIKGEFIQTSPDKKEAPPANAGGANVIIADRFRLRGN